MAQRYLDYNETGCSVGDHCTNGRTGIDLNIDRFKIILLPLLGRNYMPTHGSIGTRTGELFTFVYLFQRSRSLALGSLHGLTVTGS